jgi:SH3-like domain-containing protein
MAASAACLVASPAGAAGEASTGKVTGLPVPRYVSLKTDRVNLREGPSKDHRTAWVFQRAGLPVEIVAEFETWRRIRDAEGTEGWVLHSLLSGRRIPPVPAVGLLPQRARLMTRAADGAARRVLR